MPDEWIRARYDLPDDPRVLRCAIQWGCSPREAVGALVEFWIFTARQGVLDDDGHAVLRGMDPALLDATMRQPGFAAALMAPAVNWLRAAGGGLLVPDVLDWIGSSRDRSKWRKQKQRQRAAALVSAGCPPDVHRTLGGHSTSTSSFVENVSPLPDESTAPGAQRRSGAPAAKRAVPRRRCPDDFALTPELTAFAAERGLVDRDLAEELAKFRDHECRTPRTDWPATWRTWVRTAAQIRERAGPMAAHRRDDLFAEAEKLRQKHERVLGRREA